VFPIRATLLLFSLTAVFVPAAMFGATQPESVMPQTPPSLAGQLLVATKDMPDPRYRRTVVVVVRHGTDGGFGIVINRPTGDVPLANLLELIGEKKEKKDETITVPLYTGGPVQPETFFVLHSSEYHRPDLTADIATTASRQIFRDIAANVGPRKYLIAFGSVAWAPGQLEGQMSTKGWNTAPLNSELAFDADRDRLWALAFERSRRPPLRRR
jgi:putative transcriptional regulator